MYYPLSQIKTNLYTNGGEYIIESSSLDYIGYYWTTSKGEIFTGRNPQDVIIEKLIPISKYNSNIDILSLNQEDPRNTYFIDNNSSLFNQQSIPRYSPNIPSEQDYINTEFRRYFCKKTNEIIYIEISINSYNKLKNKDNSILWSLYEPFYIDWILVGEQQLVYKTNKNIVDLLIKQNKYHYFNNYLKNDYLKFWKS